MDFLSDLNLNGNKLQNAVVQPLSSAPLTTNVGQIYYNTSDQLFYFYDGTNWVAIGAVISVNGKNKVVSLTKSDIGLGNADNTSDSDKPISTATQTALNDKLSLSGGTMTGSISMGTNKITNVANATNDNDAVNKSQLDAAISGIGSVFKIKGSKQNYSALPTSGQEIGDVWYVVEDETVSGSFYPGHVGYVWIKDELNVERWEQLGQTVDTTLFLTKAGLASQTGGATDNTMSQAAITTALSGKEDTLTFDNAPTVNSSNPVTSDGINTAITGLIKTATGTIGANSTSVTVSYTGTILATNAVMGGEEVIVDKAITASNVTFSTATAPSTGITCTVIYK